MAGDARAHTAHTHCVMGRRLPRQQRATRTTAEAVLMLCCSRGGGDVSLPLSALSLSGVVGLAEHAQHHPTHFSAFSFALANPPPVCENPCCGWPGGSPRHGDLRWHLQAS